MFQIQQSLKPAPGEQHVAALHAPTKLHVMTSSTGQVGLAWTASKSTNVVGYIVKRSTNGKTNFIQVNTGIVTGTSVYLNTSVGRKRYYYEVFAENDSATLSTTAPRVIVDVGAATSTPAPVPTPSSINLTSLDIGSPTPGGSTNVLVDGASYDVQAGGSDIQGASDQFRFSYTELTGNFDMKVRVNSLSAADMWSKAGIMVRKTLDADARNIYVLSSPTKYRMTYRVNPGDVTTAVGDGTPNFPDNWLRMQRVGNTYTGYFSTDGVTWTEISSVTMNLGKTLFVGLATTSHNPSGNDDDAVSPTDGFDSVQTRTGLRPASIFSRLDEITVHTRRRPMSLGSELRMTAPGALPEDRTMASCAGDLGGIGDVRFEKLRAVASATLYR